MNSDASASVTTNPSGNSAGTAGRGRLVFWSISAALSGFLFGFDTVVISGAEMAISQLWGLTPLLHGLAISSALWGTVVGSLVGGWPTDRIGRKNTLIWIGFLYLLSAIWSAMAGDVYSFMVARFLGGLGVGISTVAAPLFISEIAPPKLRGRLAGMFQFNIVFGILIAYLSNFLLGQLIADSSWRWMLGAEALPAAIYMAMCFALPQSPRWLIVKKGDPQTARDLLCRLNPELSAQQIDALVNQIQESAAPASHPTGERFWSRRLRIPIMLAFLVAFFNQMSGINAILYFAPRIFGMAGMGESVALLSSVGIGVVNLIFTFIGLYLIDHYGRRTLLLIGSLGYILALGTCSATFFYYAQPFQTASAAMDTLSAVEALEKVETTSGLNEEFEAQANRTLLEARTALAKTNPAESQVIAQLPTAELVPLAEKLKTEAQTETGSGSTLVFLSILTFIAAHAVGQGAVIWVLISEVFPNRQRGQGQALGSFTHWIFAALIGMFFPVMIAALPPGVVFLFFTFMMVLQLLWVLVLVPETHGVPLEELEKQLVRD